MVEDFHVKSSCSARHCRSDPAKPNYAKGAVMDIISEHQVRTPYNLPFFVLGIFVCTYNIACAGKDKAKCQVCCRFSTDICSIGNIDTPCSRFLDIDMLTACAV